jgi:hypothetical protein
VLDLELERQGEGGWEQFARLSWFENDPWVVDRFDGWRCGVELDPLERVDDCRVRAYSGTEIRYGYVPVYADVGNVVMTTTRWSDEIPNHGATLGYYGSLEVEPAWGSLYGIRWSGNPVGTSVHEITDAVALGRELELHEPAPGIKIPTGPLDFVWSGCGDEPLMLSLHAAELDLARGDVVEILCRVADDGSFTIPAEAINEVPAGWIVEVSLQRSAAREHVVGDVALFANARTRVVHTMRTEG